MGKVLEISVKTEGMEYKRHVSIIPELLKFFELLRSEEFKMVNLEFFVLQLKMATRRMSEMKRGIDNALDLLRSLPRVSLNNIRTDPGLKRKRRVIRGQEAKHHLDRGVHGKKNFPRFEEKNYLKGIIASKTSQVSCAVHHSELTL